MKIIMEQSHAFEFEHGYNSKIDLFIQKVRQSRDFFFQADDSSKKLTNKFRFFVLQYNDRLIGRIRR